MLDEAINAWLRELLARHGAVAGTVHVVDGESLSIVAAINIPPPVVAITTTIPRGKGMAGIAWERDQPVQTCNLQDDATGAVRPGAKAVDARAAIALPVRSTSGATRAIVGLAWMDDRVLPDDVVAAITADAASLPERKT
jgi:L-methionine (R)-S-oxide reductase